jgi:hypothetical protein
MIHKRPGSFPELNGWVSLQLCPGYKAPNAVAVSSVLEILLQSRR